MIAQSTVGPAGLSMSRLASTGAFVVGAIFAACWAAAALGIVGSHASIGLFTLARHWRDLRCRRRWFRRRTGRDRLQSLRPPRRRLGDRHGPV